MNLPIPFHKDRELLQLLISGSAIILGLIWMFFGQKIVSYSIPEHNQIIFYYFLSGITFSLAAIGIYSLIRTILKFTEFIPSTDNLTKSMFKSLLEEEYEGVFLKDRHGAYKFISPVAETVLNIEGAQAINATDHQLHNASRANKFSHEDQRILKYGEAISWEVVHNTDNGEETFLCKKFPCRDNKQNIIAIAGICKNISKQKHSNNSNNDQDYRYTNLFNSLPYPALILDAISLKPLNFNSSMYKLLGYKRDEFSRMRLSLHIEPDALNNFQETIKNILKNGGGEFDTPVVTKQRDTINISGYAQEIIIDNKVYLHMLCNDNTEEKKSTDTLISSELKYRSLFEHANDAIIIVSPNTLNIIDANEIAIATLGYARDTLFLMSIHDLDASIENSATSLKLYDLENKNHALYEHEIKNINGEILEVEINAHKLNYGHDDVYQFVIRNIGERKKTEAALKSSEYRYRQMFESNMAIKLVIDPVNFTIEDANLAAANFYGYSIKELQGMDLATINILSREKLNNLIQQTREQNLSFYSCPHRLSNGEIRFVEVRDGPMEIDNKHLFYSIIYDVTASKKAENQVLVASKMFDHSTDAVMLINDNNQVVSVNYAFTQITGYQQSEIINAAPEIIMAEKNTPIISDAVHNSLKHNNQWQGEIWHRLKTGQSRPLIASINCIKNTSTNASSYVVMLSPKNSQVIDLENKIHYIELTQLPNKSLFIDRLQKAIDRAQRNKNNLGIILIDFNNFSSINAKYGYHVGDMLLKAISKRLKYNSRDCDTLSHFLSDDFAVLIEDLHDIQQIGIVAQKLLTTLSEDYQTIDHTIKLDVSMGISVYPEDGDTPNKLITRAKDALITAQQHPSNNHFELTNDAMNNSANLLLQVESNLHTALRQNEFIVLYLPQLNTLTSKLDSLEVLIRWNHPDHGYVLPDDFLPGSEQSGFIGAIGINIFDLSLQQFSEWLSLGFDIPQLNINLYQSQLDSDLLDILIEKCGKYSIPHNKICLEFSESNFIILDTQQRDTLHSLQDHDFKICIDDFGETSTSLNFLLQCTVDALKIDSTLIKLTYNSAEAELLLKGIASLCKTQNIQLIAEGVETEKEQKYLHGMSIEHMQGYLFSKPLASCDVEKFLSTL